jgi:chitosanase
MGDTDGDNPETIGEASILLAQTCFPDEGLNGNSGHETLDILCTLSDLICLTEDIVFFTEFKELDDTSITDFGALQTLGDQQMTALINSLGNGNGNGNGHGNSSHHSHSHS